MYDEKRKIYLKTSIGRRSMKAMKGLNRGEDHYGGEVDPAGMQVAALLRVLRIHIAAILIILSIAKLNLAANEM